MFHLIENNMQSSSSYPLPQCMEDQLEEICLSTQFPWYFIKETTWLENGVGNYDSTSFSHVLVMDYQPVSLQYDLFESALRCIAAVAEQPFNDIYRARLGLLYPDGKQHHNPHVDFEFPHTTALYYVNDADGCTHFFKDSMVIQRHQPAKGRMIVFDGLQLHASASPSKGVRVALNVNFRPRVC